MIRHIIFDLDGTLWDSSDSIIVIWNSVFARLADVDFQLTEEELAGLFGKTMEEIGQILFPELSEQRRKEIMEEVGQEEIVYFRDHGGILYDHVEDILNQLAEQYKLYIVSNCQDGYVESFMHAHKVEAFFTDIEMSGRTGLNKGDNIRLLMERNHISTEEAVYVGDTMGDQKAAKEAGIPFIYVSYGFGQVDDYDQKIDGIEELPAAICKAI